MGAIARRRFLVAAGAVLTAPIALYGQTRPRHRIGLLPNHEDPYLPWFREAMLRRGLREGREYVLLQPGMFWSDDPDEAARRVVDKRPEIIFTVGTQYSLAARRRTRSIPIVVWAFGYPVESGLASSLSRPGTNVTGISLYAATSIFGKLLELLRELRPEAKRIGVLMCYVPPAHPQAEADLIYRDLRQAASRLGTEIHFVSLSEPFRVDAALAELAASAPDVVLLTTGSAIWPVREKVLAFALERRWPTVTDSRWPSADGVQSLMSYGPSLQVLIDQAVAYVVRILREGARPADLPVQQPAKFELSINLRTAKALGVAVPSTLIVRADEVVE
jgi:putative ABC transport system substrate-binding protein